MTESFVAENDSTSNFAGNFTTTTTQSGTPETRHEDKNEHFEKRIKDVISTSAEILIKGVAYVRRIVQGEIIVLGILKMNPDDTSVENIVANTVLSRPRVTQILESLEKRGYVEKWSDARDKRRVRVRLTQAGLAACARTQEEVEKLFKGSLSCLEPDELDSFVHILQKLSAANKSLEDTTAKNFLVLD